MNAREQELAKEAAQRLHEDVRDAVIEGIGELLCRRSQRVSKPDDMLVDIHVEVRDFEFIYNWCATALDIDLPATTMHCLEINTVDQLAAAIEAQLHKEPTP